MSKELNRKKKTVERVVDMLEAQPGFSGRVSIAFSDGHIFEANFCNVSDDEFAVVDKQRRRGLLSLFTRASRMI